MSAARARGIGALEIAAGVGMCLRPPASMRAGKWDVLVARVLGVRTAAQGVALVARPTRDVLVGAATVDLLHAASMLGAARIWPRRRGVALASAGLAVAFGVAELVTRTGVEP